MDNEQTIRYSCLVLAVSLAAVAGLTAEETADTARRYYEFVSGTSVPPVNTSNDDIPF